MTIYVAYDIRTNLEYAAIITSINIRKINGYHIYNSRQSKRLWTKLAIFFQEIYLSYYLYQCDQLYLSLSDTDFVRYVGSKAGIQRQFNARFIESVTPIVKQAIQRSVSEMVVSDLSSELWLLPQLWLHLFSLSR